MRTLVPPRLEAAVVFLLILWYIWQLRFQFPWSWTVILAILVVSHACRKETPAALGFRRDGFRRCLDEYAPFLVLFTLLVLAAGIVLRALRRITWEDAFGSLLFYCLWGGVQQYLLNGYFVNRLRAATPAAVLFSLAHAPNWFLMIVTLPAGYLCAEAYLKHRNLYFLALAHGVVGFLLYLVMPDWLTHHFYVGPRWFSG